MMKKIFLVLFALSFYLNASVLDEKIKNIIGQREYNIHKNLIDMLFKKSKLYSYNDKLKYYNIFKTLRDNGLLNLHLAGSREVVLEFKGLNKPLKSYKILKDILHVLGYRYFFTKDFTLNEDSTLKWKIWLKAEYMLDPVVLLKELQQKNCKILNVENRGKNHWYYEIDFDRSVLSEAYEIDKNEKVKFQKPLKDYFIMVEEAKSLQIISRNLNNWFPYIVFFDNDLNVLNVIKKNRIYKGYKTKVPLGTKYIKITDMYNLINIKRGLSVIVR